MGGKLFNLPRMPRADYLEREAEIRSYLDRELPGAWRIPRYYGDKADFGDMDVLVALRPDWDEVRARITRDLGIVEAKAVGHVYSTVYRGLQTDFFTLPERFLDSAHAFMSFNDVGNFIGRICRRFDLKYGEHGLSYVYRRADGNYVKELEVTRDFAKIAAFLGLDHAAWQRGFASLAEVFDWVIASPWFSVAPYLDADADSNLRKNAKSRTTVTRFIDYLRARGVDKRVTFEDRRAYLPMVAAAFPEADLERQIALEREAEAQHLEVQAKFNGKLVMRLLPDIEGKALGELMMQIRRSRPDFDAWARGASSDEIEALIRTIAERSRDPQ